MSRRVQPLSNVCKVTSSLSFWIQTNSLIGNRLPPVNTVKNENEKRNKEALLVPPHQRLSAFYLFNLMVYFESGGDKSLIGNWPDNDDLIKKLAETVYLGDIRVVDLNVFDAQGSRIHAAKLGEHLVPGTRVAVLLDPKMSVFTSINVLSFFSYFHAGGTLPLIQMVTSRPILLATVYPQLKNYTSYPRQKMKSEIQSIII